MKAVAILLVAFAGSCTIIAAHGPSRGLLVFVRAAGEVPVPGARVDLFAGPADREYDDYDALGFRPSADPPPVLSTAVTGRDGTVAFDVPPPGRYWISAASQGFGRETVGTTVVEGSAPREIAVFLVPGSPLSGTITGDEREPLAGVEVIAAPTYQCRVWPCDAACSRTTTDSKGCFRFDALAPGEYGIWYRPGGVPVSAGTVRAPLVTHLPVHACRGGVVAGVVRDAETGAPLEGAIVRVLDSDWRTDGATVALAEARTDHAGRFEALTHRSICDLAGLAVASRGYAPTPVLVTGTLVERLADGQRLDLDLSLGKGATLRGKVVGPLGPVAGIRVSCTQEAFDERTTSVTSDADGAYRFADLDGGRYGLLVELTERNQQSLPGDIDVAAGSDNLHEIRVDDLRLSDVKGRVVDHDKGNGVPGARVWSGDGPRRAETRTDAQGRFALRITTLHGIAEITAEAPGSNLLRSQDPLDVADGEIEIRMIHGAGIRGHVRATDGSPVAGARIAAGAWFVAATTSTLPFDFDSLREGVTAPDGSYEFRVPRDAGWSADFFRAWSPVDGALVDTWSGVDEGAAWRYDTSFAEPRAVSGRAVRKGSSHGLEGLFVSLVTDDSGWGSVICAVTGVDGRFSVRLPPDDAAAIRVAGDGYVTKSVKPGEGSDLLVEMQPDLPVTGIVRLEDGAPAICAAVTLHGPEGWSSEASMTDTGGRFVIRGVPAGDYALLVDGVRVSPVPVRAGTGGLEIVVGTPK